MMEGSHRLTPEQISTFLAASTELERCTNVSKQAMGTVRRYLMRVTGRGSHRLIGEISAAGELKKAARRRWFPDAVYGCRCLTAGQRGRGASGL